METPPNLRQSGTEAEIEGQVHFKEPDGCSAELLTSSWMAKRRILESLPQMHRASAAAVNENVVIATDLQAAGNGHNSASKLNLGRRKMHSFREEK